MSNTCLHPKSHFWKWLLFLPQPAYCTSFWYFCMLHCVSTIVIINIATLSFWKESREEGSNSFRLGALVHSFWPLKSKDLLPFFLERCYNVRAIVKGKLAFHFLFSLLSKGGATLPSSNTKCTCHCCLLLMGHHLNCNYRLDLDHWTSKWTAFFFKKIKIELSLLMTTIFQARFAFTFLLRSGMLLKSCHFCNTHFCTFVQKKETAFLGIYYIETCACKAQVSPCRTVRRKTLKSQKQSWRELN